MCLLLKMAIFTKQCKLEDKIKIYISQISEFGFVTCEFLSAIYEAGWDKLTANKNQKSFRQCVSSQFNKTLSKSTKTSNPSILQKGKQTNISEIPSFIPLRLSKKILEKSNFFKKNQILLTNLQSKNILILKHLRVILTILSK